MKQNKIDIPHYKINLLQYTTCHLKSGAEYRSRRQHLELVLLIGALA